MISRELSRHSKYKNIYLAKVMSSSEPDLSAALMRSKLNKSLCNKPQIVDVDIDRLIISSYCLTHLISSFSISDHYTSSTILTRSKLNKSEAYISGIDKL